MGEIIFNRQGGGLGRGLTSNDQLSGMLFYTDTLPSGFSSSDRIKKIFSLKEAEDLGIVNDFSDETKATTGGTVQITTAGAADDVETITVEGGLLGSYTVETGDAVADVATGLAAAINARTFKTGWSATVATDTVTLVAPTGLGSINNIGTNIAFASTGTGAATVTQLSGGVSSYFVVMHYHISEFFRLQPKGTLWVGIYAQGTYDGAEIKTMQDFSEGQIRQMGVYISHETFAASQVTASQSVLDTLETENRPLSVILAADFTGITLATLSNLSTLDSERVSVCLGMDGNWNFDDYSATTSYIIGDKVNFQGSTYVCKQATTGNSPFEGAYWTNVSTNLTDLSGFTVGSVGTELGVVALSSVHENIGWVGQFALNSGNILDVAGLATGDNYRDLTVSQKETLDDYRYNYLRTYDSNGGTFFNDSWTCTLSSSDFATIENVRTLDKAVRQIRIFELPLVNSPLYVNANGTLDEGTIANFTNEAKRALIQMEIDGEISAFRVLVDPDQNVLSTSKVVISIEIVPVGVARTIENNIGFVVSIN